MANEQKRVIVIGAGVIGLTTALRLQEKLDYQVEIIAEYHPTDPKCPQYTSHWAGAHHVSDAAVDSRKGAADYATFLEMWKLSDDGGMAPGCFLRLPQTEYYSDGVEEPGLLTKLPSFQHVPQRSLLPTASHGFSFQTVTIEPRTYLPYLLSRFLAAGGKLYRGRINHINEIMESGAAPYQAINDDLTYAPGTLRTPDALVVCAGLGARTLGGVEDASVYPTRGQTVILRAPWVRFGRSFKEEKSWTYIIPRHSGDVVIGGIKGVDDWYPKPRLETRNMLLENALRVCPELVPEGIREQQTPTIDDLIPLIVDEGCGFRPSREGGFRVELNRYEFKDFLNPALTRLVPVVYNYGHGAEGYISSIGCADLVVELLQQEFS
ncbi:D-amino-acid oxidase [Panaeolus papilionaceus]|nr:D-amino-acid oxidase [Panaeolus papilionaceus]